MEEETIKKFGDDFISKDIDRRNIVAVTTVGTTGTSLALYYTKDAIRYILLLGNIEENIELEKIRK